MHDSGVRLKSAIQMTSSTDDGQAERPGRNGLSCVDRNSGLYRQKSCPKAKRLSCQACTAVCTAAHCCAARVWQSLYVLIEYAPGDNDIQTTASQRQLPLWLPRLLKI